MDLEELAYLVSYFAQDFTGKDVDQICKFLDPDGKGDVTRQEWSKKMQSGVSWSHC